MGKQARSGSGMNIPDHISESLETILWVKVLKFFDTDPGWKKNRVRDPGCFGSATLITNSDPGGQLIRDLPYIFFGP
jgi:hypothetical protein